MYLVYGPGLLPVQALALKVPALTLMKATDLSHVTTRSTNYYGASIK